MFFKAIIPLIALLYSSGAVCQSTKKAIDWFPCTQNGSLPLTCGTLTVPLDYTDNTSNASLALQLVKIKAVKQPKKGSILFNPGGPGGGGREFIAGAAAHAFLVATGGVYDLIGFDTRGTYNTIPFSCYTDPITRSAATLKGLITLNSSDTAVGQAWAVRTTLAKSCYENARDVGELIGTGFVARDMMQIVDALDEDGLLRYWGFSYGTVLGSTVAAMFPDRMDKVVLDGCLNPHDYYAGIDLEQVTSTDACFDGFFAACAAHPEQCDLAQGTRTADQLKSQSYDLLYTLKYQPFVAGTDALTEIVDYNFLKTLVENAMYDPGTWPTLATGLRGLLTKNITGIPAIAPFLVPSTPIYQNNGPDAPLGIRSSDVSLRTDNVTTLYPLFEQFYAKSRLFGDVLSLPAMMYAQWPFKAKGGYTGDFRAKTRNPILFVGSDVDPFTPLVSAQNASAGFERSVVLQHGGYGHTSLAQPSLCTAKAIRAYFVNGTLPAPGTKCEPSFGLFVNANATIDQAFSPIANFSKRALGDEDDDAALLAAVVRLNKKVPRRARTSF